MTAISPTQLSVVAAFLETSRDYLDIEHTIRLQWPRPAGAAPPRRAKRPPPATSVRRLRHASA